jgi:hypothetical protein
VPFGIKAWVKSYAKKDIQKYKVYQGMSSIHIDMPWHVSDKETYQFFKLTDNDAVPVGNEITRSGWESDSPQGYIAGKNKEGNVTIPNGHILVRYGTYPESVDIYAGPNAQALLPNKQKAQDLSNTELIILAAAHSLKSFARPKFKPEKYEELINKGLLKRNKSLTIDGENILKDPEIKEKLKIAKGIFEKQTGRYLGF